MLRLALLLNLAAAWPCLAQTTTATPPHEGVARPFKTVTISASLREVITSIAVEEGDRITKGQIIVNLEAEKESLAVERLALMLEKARFDAAAAKRLYESNVSSKDDMLAKETEQKRIDAELKIAKAEVAERAVHAPIDGVVVQRMREPGEAVNEAEPIMQVMDTDKLLVLFYLETPLLTSIKLGQEAEVVFPEVSPPVKRKGTIQFIDPAIDPRSGLFRVRVLLENKDAAARPGMKALWQVK